MRRLVYLTRAQSDFLDIADGLLERGVSGATTLRLSLALEEHCQRLAANPALAGTPRDELEPGLRSIAHRPYVIFFKYAAGALVVHRVLHGARDLPALFAPGGENDRS